MEAKQITKERYPFLLQQIPQLPKLLNFRGEIPDDSYKFLCVVGSRKYSDYGKDVVKKLIEGLRGYPVVIVSGLAIGIDSLSHEAALNAGLRTVAFPGSGLNDNVLYPFAHRNLAQRILKSGGALISPFNNDAHSTNWSFPVRNRLMAGMSHATLIIEARMGSGTLLTAGYALEFDREVIAVPGSIFSDLTYGPHMLISRGAKLIADSADILEVLGFTVDRTLGPNVPSLSSFNLSSSEKIVAEAITAPIPRDELVRKLGMSAAQANSILSDLEIRGIVTDRGDIIFRNYI